MDFPFQLTFKKAQNLLKKYTAKLSSGKTFAVGMQMTIHGTTFTVAYHQAHRVLRKTYGIYNLFSKNLQEIFAIESKIGEKVFLLKSFAICGSCYTYISAVSQTQFSCYPNIVQVLYHVSNLLTSICKQFFCSLYTAPSLTL